MKIVASIGAAAVIAVASLASFNSLAAKHDESKMAKPAADASTAMTMVFHVKDKAMLDKVKTGDKIKFNAINDNGKMTVTEIQSGK